MAIIEQNKKFSESALWKLQDAAYSQFGPKAWAQKGVPFYLTSNPLIAKQFSEMIKSYLDETKELDPTEPVYLFDLGAGSGRLGYLLIKYLKKLLGSKQRFVYVMTDMVEENLSFLQKHPLLGAYFDEGILDCTFYKHDQKESITLAKSGKVLGKTKNPIVLICTYYFDTIPQDLFRAKGGELEEGRVTLSVPEGISKELDPQRIMEVEASYEYQTIKEIKSYYSDPSANVILQEYANTFTNTPFLFPYGGIESLDYFKKLSNGRFLLLSGDQGVCTEEQVREWGEPEISRHSSFSIAVSYHALASYFEREKGLAMLTTNPDPQFVVMAGIYGEGKYQNTYKTFYREIDSLEPVEYWNLTSLSSEQCKGMTLGQLLILIKLGNYDPLNLHFYFDAIRSKMAAATAQEIERLKNTVNRCIDNFYPIDPSEGDFFMNMGVLFFELKTFENAMIAFQLALEVKGVDQQLLVNIAHCQKAMQTSDHHS